MMRLRAILCCLWFGLLPWRVYEDRCHYAPQTWTGHALLNLRRAWLFLRCGESPEDWDFEREKNNPPRLIRPMIRRILTALLLGLALAGCRHAVTREVFVRVPAPAPTIVVSADTLVVTTPPDTVFVPREVLVPGATRVVVERDTVTRTVPAVVVRYATPRPDTSQAVRLYALRLSGDSLTLAGTDRDWTFLAPRAGETLLVEGRGPRELVAAVRGTPRASVVSADVDCAAETPVPPALVERSVAGWTKLVGWMIVACCVGAVAVLVVRR